MFVCVCVCVCVCECESSFIQSSLFPHSLINGTDHPQTCRQECVHTCVCFAHVCVCADRRGGELYTAAKTSMKAFQVSPRALPCIDVCVCVYVCVCALYLGGGEAQAPCQAPSFPGFSPLAKCTNVGQESQAACCSETELERLELHLRGVLWSANECQK